MCGDGSRLTRERYAAAPMFELPSLARRLSETRLLTGMRLLSVCLFGLWAAVAIGVALAYQPGGPFDLLVRIAIFGPVLIAALSVRWPPGGDTWRVTASIAWLGFIALLLLVPLLGGVVETLRTTGRQALFPSAEVAYAGLLALGTTCLYAAVGVVRSRDPAVALSRPTFMQALSLAVAMTVLAAGILGVPSLANELALRDRPQVASRFGPTDSTLPLPDCDTAPLIGGSATLGGDAAAEIDGIDAANIQLTGVRLDPVHENWTASRTGRFGVGTATYQRAGNQATIADTSGAQPVVPADLGLVDPRGLTVDGPIATLVAGRGPARVAEDRGTELIEEARSRHCRITIDGPSAVAASVLVRLIIDGSLHPKALLAAWRGSLDWWVFADGELGQAVLTISGYPGDAWTSGGVQASIVARITATDRAGSAIIPIVISSPEPVSRSPEP